MHPFIKDSDQMKGEKKVQSYQAVDNDKYIRDHLKNACKTQWLCMLGSVFCTSYVIIRLCNADN